MKHTFELRVDAGDQIRATTSELSDRMVLEFGGMGGPTIWAAEPQAEAMAAAIQEWLRGRRAERAAGSSAKPALRLVTLSEIA